MWSGFKQGRKASLYYSNSAERILRRVRILGRTKSKQGYKANLPINFVFIQNAPLMLQKKPYPYGLVWSGFKQGRKANCSLVSNAYREDVSHKAVRQTSFKKRGTKFCIYSKRPPPTSKKAVTTTKEPIK